MQKRTEIETISNINNIRLETPWFQRPIYESHIEKIYKKALEYLQNNIEPLLPLMCIGWYPVSNNGIWIYKYHIIDGQHRYYAYRKLANDGYLFPITFQKIICGNEIEAYEQYCLYNTRIEHTISDLQRNDSISLLDTEIRKLLTTKYNDYFSHESCKRPRIRLNDFLNRFENSNDKSSILNINDFSNYLNLKNEEIKYKINFSPNLLVIWKVTESIRKKSEEMNFYLGLDSNLSWID